MAENLTWTELVAIADEEIEKLIGDLPSDLQKKARTVPLTLEPKPNTGWVDDGVEADSLGLFIGPAYGEEGQTNVPLPAQIILFLENIWDFAENDSSVYRQEIRRTYFHELGHFLGLAEDDLFDRGLD